MDDREPEGGSYIACRIEAHCLAVRPAQILLPSPANAGICWRYIYTNIERVSVYARIKAGMRQKVAGSGE